MVLKAVGYLKKRQTSACPAPTSVSIVKTSTNKNVWGVLTVFLEADHWEQEVQVWHE